MRQSAESLSVSLETYTYQMLHCVSSGRGLKLGITVEKQSLGVE